MDGLVGLWHLNETAGTSGASSVIDGSANSNHGTPVNAIFGNEGILKNAISFDGDGDSVNLGSQSSLDDIEEITI